MGRRRDPDACAGSQGDRHAAPRRRARPRRQLPAGDAATGAGRQRAGLPAHRLHDVRSRRGSLAVRLDGHALSRRDHAGLLVRSRQRAEGRVHVRATRLCRHGRQGRRPDGALQLDRRARWRRSRDQAAILGSPPMAAAPRGSPSATTITVASSSRRSGDVVLDLDATRTLARLPAVGVEREQRERRQ